MPGSLEEGAAADCRPSSVTLIGGVDEVGVGCLAGPCIVVCLILPVPMDISRIAEVPKIKAWWPLEEVKDSKLTSEMERNALHRRLVAWVSAIGGGVGVGEAPVQMFNEHGHKYALDTATSDAVQAAIDDIGQRPRFLVVDGSVGVNGYPGLQRIEPKADKNYFVVAAASILAKIIRDERMMELDRQFPQYGWRTSKGYPTQMHRRALQDHGLSEHHRQKACGTVLRKHPPQRKPTGW